MTERAVQGGTHFLDTENHHFNCKFNLSYTATNSMKSAIPLQQQQQMISRLSQLSDLSLVNRFIYFSSIGNSSQITRADMDGNNNIVLANLSNVGSTYIDVALDKTGNRLFFSDKTNNVIRYIDLRNMEILTLLSGNLHRPTSLTMLNNTLYWTAEGYGRYTGAIFKAEASNASKAQMIADGFSYPKGIYVHGYLGTQIPGNCFKDTSDLNIYIICIICSLC